MSANVVLLYSVVFLTVTIAIANICSLNRNVVIESITCVKCSDSTMDSGSTMLPQPEVVWATSGYVLFRARIPCTCRCRSQLQWIFYEYDKEMKIMNNDPGPWSDCYGKEHCMKINHSPGLVTTLSASTGFILGTAGRYLSNETKINFCPAQLPPKPENLECRRHDKFTQLRWRHLPDICPSYVQYMLSAFSTHTRNSQRPEKVEFGIWKWLGEVSPNGHSFAGLVQVCSDDKNLLCADIQSVNIHTVKLGVRRIDADNTDDVINMTTAKCQEIGTTHNFYTTARTTTTHSAPAVQMGLNSDGQAQSTSLASASNQPNMSDSSLWSMMALGLMCALVITIAMIPLAFLAGRRCERYKKGVPWRPMNDETSRNGSNANVPLANYGQQPPGYVYDYAANCPPRLSLPPPPLPPTRVTPTADVRNEMYEYGAA